MGHWLQWLLQCYNALTHHHHPESTADIRVTLGIVHSVGVDKCMTRTHHSGVMQNGFIALKTLCALPACPSQAEWA